VEGANALLFLIERIQYEHTLALAPMLGRLRGDDAAKKLAAAKELESLLQRMKTLLFEERKKIRMAITAADLAALRNLAPKQPQGPTSPL
jgi:hypothetical protein